MSNRGNDKEQWEIVDELPPVPASVLGALVPIPPADGLVPLPAVVCVLDGFGQARRLQGEIAKMAANIVLYHQDLQRLNQEMGEANQHQEAIRNQIATATREQADIMRSLDRRQAEIAKISRRSLEVQEQQLAVQEEQLKLQGLQVKIKAKQLEEMQLQTQLQQAMAQEMQLQTKVAELNRQMKLAKGKLDSAKDYLKMEVERLDRTKSLPDLVKYMLVEQYLSYINTDPQLSQAVEVLELSATLFFGAVWHRLEDLKTALYPRVAGEIEGVMRDLGYCVLLENIGGAANILEELLGQRATLRGRRSTLASCQADEAYWLERQVDNPSNYLGFFHRITRGLLTQRTRELYSEYRRLVKSLAQARASLAQAAEALRETSREVATLEETLTNNGYPTSERKFRAFHSFLHGCQKNLIARYPYFSQLRSAYNPFKP